MLNECLEYKEFTGKIDEKKCSSGNGRLHYSNMVGNSLSGLKRALVMVARGKIFGMYPSQKVGGEAADDQKVGGEVAGDQMVGGEAADDQKNGGEVVDDQKINGEAADDQKTNGEAADGQKINGEAADDQKTGDGMIDDQQVKQELVEWCGFSESHKKQSWIYQYYDKVYLSYKKKIVKDAIEEMKKKKLPCSNVEGGDIEDVEDKDLKLKVDLYNEMIDNLDLDDDLDAFKVAVDGGIELAASLGSSDDKGFKHKLQPLINTKKSYDKLHRKSRKYGEKIFKDKKLTENTRNEITFDKIIAEAYAQGPLKRYYLVASEDPFAQGKIKIKTKTKESSRIKDADKDIMLKTTAAFLLNKLVKDQESVVFTKADLANWCCKDADKINFSRYLIHSDDDGDSADPSTDGNSADPSTDGDSADPSTDGNSNGSGDDGGSDNLNRDRDSADHQKKADETDYIFSVIKTGNFLTMTIHKKWIDKFQVVEEADLDRIKEECKGCVFYADFGFAKRLEENVRYEDVQKSVGGEDREL